MRGRSHKIFNLGLAILTENIFHPAGAPIHSVDFVTHSELMGKIYILKGVYYGCALLVASLPDADLHIPIFGKHRGFTHSLLSCFLFAACLLAAGLLTLFLLHANGIPASQELVAVGLVAIVSSTLGYFYHLLADSLTVAGISFFWPASLRIRLLPRSHSIKTGRSSEYVAVCVVVLTIGFLIWRNLLGI